MHIKYYCRHCNSTVGEVDAANIDQSKLGFHSLTPAEAADIISYNSLENSTYVKTICEYCQEAIEAHPELSLLSNPLQ
jgi:hypothetical protein